MTTNTKWSDNIKLLVDLLADSSLRTLKRVFPEETRSCCFLVNPIFEANSENIYMQIVIMVLAENPLKGWYMYIKKSFVINSISFLLMLRMRKIQFACGLEIMQ